MEQVAEKIVNVVYGELLGSDSKDRDSHGITEAIKKVTEILNANN